jgi:glutathione S-transferase
VIGALERLAGEATFLCGDPVSLADIHLAPMIGYFAQTPEGAALVSRHSRLARWWAVMSERSTFRETMPELPRQPAR